MSFASDPTRSHVWELPASRPRLVVLWEGGSGGLALADGDVVVLGRGDDCTVQIFHKSVSRRHVEIRFGREITVHDLGSANGTRIAGRVLARGETTRIDYGTAIEIGAAIAVVHPADARAAANPAASSAMDRVRQFVKLVAPAPIPVLLLGETGVGKEVISSEIHAASPRAAQRLVKINCAAFSESLLESELFGHERGAFTGAATAKTGLLEEADKGTLFLDEVGELPLSFQAKLLRVLEDREVRRVGATRGRPIDVRFVAATNRDLVREIERGTFRSDLYFRLNGMTIHIPPLRERTDEILPLARHFLGQAYARVGMSAVPLAPAIDRALLAYTWPGNVRELRNVIERAVLLAAGGPIAPMHLVFERSPEPSSRTPIAAPTEEALPAELSRLEQARIEQALVASGGNQTLAAQALGITRRQLIGRIELYGLARPRKKG